MLVTDKNIAEVCDKLLTPGVYSLDTETTGLNLWHNDRLFSIIISDGTEAYYFDFKEGALDRKGLAFIQIVLNNASSEWFMHNAKFDLTALYQEGLTVAGLIHCTEAIGRVEKNNRFNYKLETLAKDIGDYKSDVVKDYIKKHKLYRKEADATGELQNIPMFNRVPLEVMQPYAEQDALVTWKLGIHQIEAIENKKRQIESGKPSPFDIMQMERRLTATCFRMEQAGIRVDRDFCRRALKFEQDRMKDAKAEFKKLTGSEFVDSAKALAPAFDKVGERYPTTEKGNPSFTAEVLEEFTSPLARLVLDYRNAQKRANTYFANFIHYADANGYIHANIRQGGTETGRFSYSNPNLQNLPKRKELKDAEFNVRRAVVPSPGNCLVMLDMDQVEYRLMLDYAGQKDVIEQVIAGLDVHQATANLMGVTRDEAKTLNFMLLYGGGIAKLCMALFSPTLQLDQLKEIATTKIYRRPKKGHSLLGNVGPELIDFNLTELRKAHALQELYFEKLPKVKEFTKKVIATAGSRGWVKNWAGRICLCENKEFAYAMPNHLIQGGCADILKFAMNDIDDLLIGKRSKMIIQVHDELVFDMHPSELHLVLEIQKIMQSAYKHKYLPLTCGIDHSWKSWADKVEGVPA